MKSIAFFNSLFPALSATFIYKEALELKKRGLPIKTFAIRKPPLDEISKECHGLRETTTYLLPANIIKFIGAHLYFLLKHPLRYFGTLIFLLTRKFNHKLKDRYRTILHFCEGVLLAKLLTEDDDICHIHVHYAAHPASVAIAASKLTGIPFSFTAHAYDIWIDRLFIEDKVNAARFAIACTKYGREQILKNNGIIDPKKLVTIYHGIDTEKFAPRETPTRNSKTTILHVGRLSEEKAQANIILACKILKRDHYDFQCLIIGDGPLYNDLKGLIVQNDLDDQVKLVGKVFQEEIIDYYAKADMFVLSSYRENMPNVLVESMSMGIPTIATAIAAIPELIQDGENGLLVEPNNIEQLAQAMKRLIDKKEFAQQIAQNGRNTVLDKFDHNDSLDQLIELYRKHDLPVNQDGFAIL
jgi:glycosyltransferase involved in cell wall biosynthesis